MMPAVTVAQMREVDRLMLEEMQISLLQMMENAGRTLAQQARALLGGDPRGRRIVVLAGSGGNGGGGLAAARRLHIWGAEVVAVLAQPSEWMADVPRHQLAALERMRVPVLRYGESEAIEGAVRNADLILDALIGYSLKGPPREPIASLIRGANASDAPILSLDIPSGMNGDTGEAYQPTIRAKATLTLALPKVGLLQPATQPYVGELWVADISVPELVYQRLGLSVGPIFARSDVVPVDGEGRDEQ